ncbi:MAG: hypothetical protein ACU0AU_04820 [Cognatishimia activa]
MNDPQKWVELPSWLFGDATSAAIAGAAGGLVRWLTLRESFWEGLQALLVGSICAIYLGPLVEPLLAPVIGKIAPDNDSAGFSSFVVGLGGISIAGFVIDIIKGRRKQLSSPSGGDPDEG